MNQNSSTKEKSLTKNGFYYLVYNVLNVIFPFLTGIYVVRFLLPETIGMVASAQNLVTYFSIFAFLGIPTYGMREISKQRNSRQQLNKIYSELMILNLISTLFFTVLYYGLIFSVPAYRENLILYSMLGLLVILNALNNTWLYDGLEELKFISIRNLVFKVIVFVILIVFVKNDDDYLLYASLTVIGTVGNYIINIIFSRKYVSFTFKNLELKRHIKSVCFLAMVNFAIEIYTLVDITMLDLLSQKENIAFYSYGSKINKILLQIVNTITIVLVPRISLYYKEGRMEEYNKLINKALSIIVLISVPMIIGIQFVSKFIICKIYGDTYINSATILCILSAVLLISPIGYLLGSRTLLVTGNEKKMVYPVGIGGIVNIILNYFLIKEFNEFGAALASVISELVVCFVYVLFGRKYFTLYKGTFVNMTKILISALGMSGGLVLLTYFIENELLKCCLEILLACSLYALLLIILREETTRGILKKLKRV